MDTTRRDPSLLTWQWNGYATFHAGRRNLLVHALTQPVFATGFLAVLTSPLGPSFGLGLARAVLGVAAMGGAMALQGRGHAKEEAPPIPFSGPRDVVVRILSEQLITFPRFVLSGGFARAWRDAER
jgi:hypothetical protein